MYNDDWNDSSGLILINYDTNTQKFTGSIDFNTHDFSEEGVTPAGTQINNFKLILRNQARDRQSADLLASDYGFQPTTTADMTELAASEVMYINNGQLYVCPEFTQQNVNIKIFDMNGKLVLETQSVKKTLNLSNLSSQVYIIKAVINKEKFAVMKMCCKVCIFQQNIKIPLILAGFFYNNVYLPKNILCLFTKPNLSSAIPT